MTDPAWAKSLDGLLDEVWRRLEAGEGAARHPALATAGADGPAVRTVVLRGADRGTATLEIHTDAASSKVRDLRRFARAALHVWDPEAALQIRLGARVGIAEGDAAAATWSGLSDAVRGRYGGTEPGALLAAPEVLRDASDPGRFAVLAAHVDRVDALHLGVLHRRAVFVAADAFAGAWVAP